MEAKKLQMMHKYKPEEVYDLVADQDYDATYHNADLTPNYEAADRIVYGEILKDLISPKDRILEIGYGNGDTIKWLSSQILPSNYLGVDPSKKMSQRASALYPEYTFLDTDLESQHLSSNQYDKIISLYAPPSYLHLPNKHTRLVYSLLKPGGAYISGPYTHLMAFGPRLQPNTIDQYPETPRNFFLENDYTSILKKNGLDIVDKIGIDYVTHQQVYIDLERKKLGVGKLQPVDYYYSHMKTFDALARRMQIPVTDFRHCLYIAKKPL
jgi:SAM-dependent methyltransferase